MNMTKKLIDEIGNKSREFYEFVLPPIDMYINNNDDLIIEIDIPGFNKKDIKLSIHKNILSIEAKKQFKDERSNNIIWKQKPNIIDKKILLPEIIKEGIIASAKYLDGVLTVSIPKIDQGKNITIE
ncbi:MAG: Hsp20/alpha crystallin family protein [Nitrosopumilaceae archaeon]|nr:Hsp20/alpha crystallin family protein [Nitrosopumilaceae archaeon]